MTLGWPQFVALVAGLCTIAAVVTIMLQRDISEYFHRLEVRPYEQELGFEIGLVKGFPNAPKEGWWGIAHVTPGGAMHRAGLRSGDLVFSYHGYAFSELRWVIGEAVRGRTACVFVMNAEERRTGSGREVCLKGITKD
jgi:predicted metalloprotease with PDZ domain